MHGDSSSKHMTQRHQAGSSLQKYVQERSSQICPHTEDAEQEMDMLHQVDRMHTEIEVTTGIHTMNNGNKERNHEAQEWSSQICPHTEDAEQEMDILHHVDRRHTEIEVKR